MTYRLPNSRKSNFATEPLEFVRAGHQPRRLLQLVQLVEGLLYVSGVIGILAGRIRVTRHDDAPLVSHLL